MREEYLKYGQFAGRELVEEPFPFAVTALLRRGLVNRLSPQEYNCNDSRAARENREPERLCQPLLEGEWEIRKLADVRGRSGPDMLLVYSHCETSGGSPAFQSGLSRCSARSWPGTRSAFPLSLSGREPLAR